MLESKTLNLAKRGYSVQAITDKLSVPRSRIVKLFQKHGLPIRTRTLYGPEVQAQIIFLHQQGKTLAQIAKEMDMWDATVKKILIKAGLDPRTNPKPVYTDLDVECMLALYSQGLTPNAIGKKMGINPTTVYSRLRNLGIALDSRPTYTDEDKQQIVSLFMSGDSPNAIAKQLKIAPATVRRILKRAGEAVPQIPMHTAKEIEDILRLRRKGMCIYSISAALNIPSSSVFYWVVKQPDYEPKHYLKTRRYPYRSEELSSRSLSDQQIIQIVRLHRQGMTVASISKQMKISQSLVRHVLG